MSGVLATLALLATAALGPQLEVSIAPQELTVGDRAEITLSVRFDEEPAAGSVAWPQWEGTLGKAEILDVGPVAASTPDGGGTVLSRKLAVTFFEVGEAVIPALQVAVTTASGTETLTSDEIRLTIRSVLPEGDEKPEAKPPAPVQSLGIGDRFWWASGALLATCLVALTLLARQSRGSALEVSSRSSLTPRQELERSLESLRAETDPELVHAGVSMTARRYLGRVLDFPAPESTTSEVQRQLRSRKLDAEVVRQTGRLLLSCDMVMFARRTVDIEQGRERIDETESVANAIDRSLRPVDSAASSAAAGDPPQEGETP